MDDSMMTKYSDSVKDAKHMKMSMEDITKKLHGEFEEEIEGANNYLDMAISASDMEHNQLSNGLANIAYDEYTHAMFIHDFLKKSGVTISEDHEKKFNEMVDRFQRELR
jgi:ferritin